MNVAKKYGMVQLQESENQSVRTVLFINLERIIKAFICNLQSLGRNFDEIKRALIALQTAEEFGVSTPAD